MNFEASSATWSAPLSFVVVDADITWILNKFCWNIDNISHISEKSVLFAIHGVHELAWIFLKELISLSDYLGFAFYRGLFCCRFALTNMFIQRCLWCARTLSLLDNHWCIEPQQHWPL
jgi:hypothetical protein